MSGETNVTVVQGLEGVVVGTTEISLVDGRNGRLVVRGHDIRELQHATFEDMCHLLWYGRLPGAAERETLRARMAAARALPEEVLGVLRALPRGTAPLEAVRTALSATGTGVPHGALAPVRAALVREALVLTARTAAILAAFECLRRGHALPAVPPQLRHAEAYLYALDGAQPEPARVRALDTYMLLLAEHGMNASTFTARVVASTQADMTSAVVAALAALKGPLHGGAPALVLDMLRAVGTPDNAEPWMAAELARGARLMGFGHRVYRTADPRGEILRALAREVCTAERFALAQTVEETGLRLLHARKPDRELYANVEFYSAAVLDAAGLPGDLFTPSMAAARMAGWTAHVIEQFEHNRLIRPEVQYVGPLPEAA